MAARIKAQGGRLFGRYGPQYKDGGGGGSGGPRALILVEGKESGQNLTRCYIKKNVIISQSVRQRSFNDSTNDQKTGRWQSVGRNILLKKRP